MPPEEGAASAASLVSAGLPMGPEADRVTGKLRDALVQLAEQAQRVGIAGQPRREPVNQKNVEALERLLDEANAAFIKKKEFPVIGANYVEDLARLLAASGVLVPSVLTDEQAAVLAYREDAAFLATFAGAGKAMRAELERIARGTDGG